MLFWIFAGLMIFLLLAIVAWGLFSFKNERDEYRNSSLNRIVYQDQIAELNQDFARGAISKQELDDGIEEIEKRIIHDAKLSEVSFKDGPKLLTLVILLGIVPPLAIFLYLSVGNPSLVNYTPVVHGGAKVTEDNTLEMDGVQQVDERMLKKYLEESPKDMRGWLQYARILEKEGRWREALNAMDKVFELSPNKAAKEPTLIIEKALIMMELNDPLYRNQIQAELDKAIELNPDDPSSRELAAGYAYQTGDYRKAVEHWNHLLGFYQPGSPEANRLIDAIADAQNRATMQFGGMY